MKMIIPIVLLLVLVFGIMTFTTSAFADTTVTMTKGSSAGQDCVQASNCFDPAQVNVAPGDTVTWTNADTASHTVTSGNPSDATTGTIFDSSLVKAGATFAFKFTNTGTYNYYCQVHPWMIGSITVSGNPQPTPQPTPVPPQNFPTQTIADIKMTQGSSAGQSCVSANNCFSPAVFKITQGQTVTWGNDDTASHTVTNGKPSDATTGTIFDSGLIKSGGTFSYTFSNDGTYYYYCQVHPWMTGTIIVGNGGSEETPSPTQMPSIPPMPSGIDITMTKGSSAGQDCVSADNCFSPYKLSANVGQTITWFNSDTASHTVTSGNPSDNSTGTVFDSGLVKTGATFAFKFTDAETYNYYCQVHPWMTGEIIVGGGGTVPSQPILNASPQDLASIDEARNNQDIAAEVNVVNQTVQTTSIDNNVSVQAANPSSDSLSISVTASSQTGPKVLVVNLAATTINVANLKDLGVMYDGNPIQPASNIDSILHAKSTDSPSFAIVVTQSGAQILILIPHFSTHNITITNLSKVVPAVPEFPIAALVLVASMIPIILLTRKVSYSIFKS